MVASPNNRFRFRKILMLCIATPNGHQYVYRYPQEYPFGAMRAVQRHFAQHCFSFAVMQATLQTMQQRAQDANH